MEAIIENGMVMNAEQLKLYWAERNHREYLMRRGMFADLRARHGREDTLPEVPDPPVIPHSNFLQMRGDLLNLRNKLVEHLANTKKKRDEYEKQKQDTFNYT